MTRGFNALQKPRGDSEENEKLRAMLKSRGTRLRKWRHMAGYSATGLARELNCDRHTVNHYEEGGNIPRFMLDRLDTLGFPSELAILTRGKKDANRV